MCVVGDALLGLEGTRSSAYFVQGPLPCGHFKVCQARASAYVQTMAGRGLAVQHCPGALGWLLSAVSACFAAF
jgi:hypothetical protein